MLTDQQSNKYTRTEFANETASQLTDFTASIRTQDKCDIQLISCCVAAVSFFQSSDTISSYQHCRHIRNATQSGKKLEMLVILAKIKNENSRRLVEIKMFL